MGIFWKKLWFHSIRPATLGIASRWGYITYNAMWYPSSLAKLVEIVWLIVEFTVVATMANGAYKQFYMQPTNWVFHNHCIFVGLVGSVKCRDDNFTTLSASLCAVRLHVDELGCWSVPSWNQQRIKKNIRVGRQSPRVQTWTISK